MGSNRRAEHPRDTACAGVQSVLMSTPVTMYFDATCPFAWVTSRWLKEVEKVRDIDLSYSPMSLAVLNEGRDELPEEYRNAMEAAWGPALVAAALQLKEPAKVDAYYTAIGTLIHDRGEGHKQGSGAYDELVASALADAGADASYLDYAHKRGSEEGSVEADLRDFQEKAMEKVGNDVGTPVVELGGHAFFGPVITRVPKGEEAGALFDAAVTLGSYDHFFELKRSRTEGPDATI